MNSPSPLPPPNEFAHLWGLDPEVSPLNHGSFGACPKAILNKQEELRLRMEAEAVSYFLRDFNELIDEARRELANFVGVNTKNLIFVRNATEAVNTVIAALDIKPGDRLLTTSHDYNACRNSLRRAAEKFGAEIVVAPVPFPLTSAEEVVDAVKAKITDKVKFALIDHITSPTAVIFPVSELVVELEGRGIITMVDGAHAPGMMPLEIEKLGASFYTGNCHKWLCAPKGAAFLYARSDRQNGLHPLVISHGYNSTDTSRPALWQEFDWTGTDDYSPLFCIPEAIRYMGGLLPGGWPELMRTNRELASKGREILCKTLGLSPPCPDHMLGSMASIVLPPIKAKLKQSFPYIAPLQEYLFEAHKIEVPIIPRPEIGVQLLRISAQLYNRPAEYERLAQAIAQVA